MRRGTLLALALLVGALLWLRTRGEEALAEQEGRVFKHAILTGFHPDAVAGMRIESLERGYLVDLERDSQGLWYLTEPIEYPADDDLVNTQLRLLADLTGFEVPTRDPASLGFDPPQMVVELREGAADGAATRRIEVGTPDLDEDYIHVRVPKGGVEFEDTEDAGAAPVLRVSLSLFTTLNRVPTDFREKRLFPFSSSAVTGLRRWGSVNSPQGEPIDLALDALAEHDGWYQIQPPRVALDPSSLGILVQSIVNLRVVDFFDDVASERQFGLDEPEFFVELTEDRGTRTVLELGRPAPARDEDPRESGWFGRLRGSSVIVELDPEDLVLAMQAAELYYDQRILRVLRKDVLSVRLEPREGPAVLLERDERDWWVSGLDGEQRFPADHGRVEDILATLEKAELSTYPRGATLPEDEALGTIMVVARGETRYGGYVGEARRDPRSGAEGHLFRRYRDEIPALVGADVVGLLELDRATLRRRLIHRFEESRVQRVELERAGHELVYVQRKDEQARSAWYPAGKPTRLPADSPFLAQLDGLLSLRASAWLEEVAAEPPEDSVRVTLEGAFGTREVYLGRDAEGPLVQLPDGQRARLEGPVLERVEALFE